MRQWTPTSTPSAHAGFGVLGDIVGAMALPGFAGVLLQRLRSVVPGTSLSVYRTGAGRRPQRYLGSSHRTPDTTRDCWRAYMSGPYMRDQSLMQYGALMQNAPMVCHVTAHEVPDEHRIKVYEAHGLAERVSVVRRDPDGSVFAINLYRHLDQPAFRDRQLADFAELAPTILVTTRKHLSLLGLLVAGESGLAPAPPAVRELLLAMHPRLTARELDVCERLLRGMTDEGIATELALGLPTVRTYRNRAFARLDIHLRSELFALMRARGG